MGQGPKNSAPHTAQGVLHIWHPELTICSELTAARARGVGLERDKDTAWGMDGFVSTAAMNSINVYGAPTVCAVQPLSPPAAGLRNCTNLFGYTLKLEKNPVYIVL